MPDFTFIKHGSGEDPNLTMVFSSDSLETVRECFEDFARGSGFVIEEEVVTEGETEDWEYEEAEKPGVIPMPDLNENLAFLNKYLSTEYEEH